MMQKSRFLFCGMIFFLSTLLAGCGNKETDSQDEQQYQQGAVYQWEEGPVKEIALPSVDGLMEEKNLSLIWQSDTMVTPRTVWKMVATKNEQMEYKTYYLFFPFEKAEWVMVESADGTTQDGIPYAFFLSPSLRSPVRPTRLLISVRKEEGSRSSLVKESVSMQAPLRKVFRMTTRKG